MKDNNREIGSVASLFLLNKQLFNFKIVSFEALKDGYYLNLICSKCGQRKRIKISKSKVYPLFCSGCHSQNYMEVRFNCNGIAEYRLIPRLLYIKLKKNKELH